MRAERSLWVHVVVLVGLAVLAAHSAQAASESPTGERRIELINMVRQDCGSCHGLSLKGGLGPALLPATLAARPAESLVATVLQGRPGTPMPGWSRFVSEAEAAWIVERLRAGFPQLAEGGEAGR